MQNFLIGIYDGVLIYGSENENNELEIKFIEIPPLCDISPLDMLRFRDFRQGYIRLADFEMRRYGNYIYCRIYASMFRIDIAKRSYEDLELEFNGVCFLEDYILIAKRYPVEKLFKLIPPGTEIEGKECCLMEINC